MIDFSKIENFSIPEGTVNKITVGGKVLWEKYVYSYVSLGDSIAAGQRIREESHLTNTNEIYKWQYGTDGVKSTSIISGSYTDLIGKQIKSTYGNNVSIKSFARSGDTVKDLLNKLRANGGNNPVANSVRNANIVTISIGANDVLQPAMDHLWDYINYGDLSQLGAILDHNINILETDSNPYSYVALLTELNNLNDKAQYVFTTVYNPYKYLWLQESTSQANYKDGFLGPLMWIVPDSVIGETLANQIRGAIYRTDIVQKLFQRTNGLGNWVETYVNRLNQALKNTVSRYTNCFVADSKLLFESVPDRPISADKHYNDLVNVEFTRGYKVEDMDWGQFWGNVDWWSILSNINSVANQVIENVVKNVIEPDADPHPEAYGHEMLKCAFEEALGWRSLTRYTVSYGAGEHGKGEMATQEVIGLNGTIFALIKPNAFTSKTTGYYYAGWDKGTYINGYYYVWINSDTTINARWSNLYQVTYKHSDASNYYASDATGHQENYDLKINGEDKGSLGSFTNGARYFNDVPYGSQIEVACTYWDDGSVYDLIVNKVPVYKSASVDVYLNGSSISNNGSTRPSGYYPYGSSSDFKYPNGKDASAVAYYKFTLTGDTTIEFRAKTNAPALYNLEAFWDCYITT